MNRKAFRQGYEYVIEKIEILGTSGIEQMLTIETISPSWVACNSWVKGFSHWKAQQDEFLDDAGQESRKARYNDFKIFMDTAHVASPTPLLPTNTITEAAAQAIDPTVQTEWDMSQVVVPNDGAVGTTNEYFLKMVGADQAIGAGDCKGLIHNYALSRQRPHVFDPNQVSPSTDGGLYQDMVDVGDNLEEVGQNVSTNNFVAPYLIAQDSVFEWYPGGANNHQPGITNIDTLSVRSGTGSISTDSSLPFTALCGLIKLSHAGEAPLGVRITYAPGHYKGVMARPMQDVN